MRNLEFWGHKLFKIDLTSYSAAATVCTRTNENWIKYENNQLIEKIQPYIMVCPLVVPKTAEH